MSGGELAGFPGVERGFTSDSGLDLLPGEVGESLRDAGAFYESVSYVDVELECDGKFVFHQAGRDEDALRVAQIQVAMADCVVTEDYVVTIGDDRFFALGYGERYEVIGLAA